MPSRMTAKRRLSKRKRPHASSKSKKSRYADPPQDLASLIRGMYGRVARSLHFHPSYVSRVARGERKSPLIDAALRRELKKIVRSTTPEVRRRGSDHNPRWSP